MSQQQSCPNCPASISKTVFNIGNNRRVLQCQQCGLQFAQTYPEYVDADAEIYSYDYFKGSIEKEQQREMIFSELLKEVESMLHCKGRLLDIGAGEGMLLKIAEKHGWTAEGTEIASAMIRYTRDDLGLTVHQGVLEDISLPDHAFDAVIMNHVLEHVKNPRSTLEKVMLLLKPGGVVRIEVPNLSGLSSRVKNFQSRRRLKKNPWKHYSTGHHFWFFTPRTLRHTIETSGLSVLMMNAPAEQWGRKNPLTNLANTIYNKMLWGGHLVAYAKIPQTGEAAGVV
jgi:2-polyprenyl-3-methyl-5-hydroxy-6-metoxy-1,4-benzoquinol methylase